MAAPHVAIEEHDARPWYRSAAQAAVGVAGGLVAYYVVVVIATAPLDGAFTTHPLVLVGLVVAAAGAVTAGSRWPIVGVAAGAVMLLVTVFAVTQRISWTTGTTQWLSPFDAIGYGAVSGYPAMTGAVLIAGAVIARSAGRGTRP